MLDAMQASRVCAPAFCASSSTSQMHLRRNRRAVDEQLAARVVEQVVVRPEKIWRIAGVIGNNGDDHVRRRGHFA